MGRKEDGTDPIGPVGRFGCCFGYCSKVPDGYWDSSESEKDVFFVAKRKMVAITQFQPLLRAFRLSI